MTWNNKDTHEDTLNNFIIKSKFFKTKDTVKVIKSR